MGVIKGNIASNNTTQKDATVTESGDKVGLDVSIVGGSTSGSGSSGGSNSLASGSLLYGLDWRGSTSDLSNATQDTITYYSDPAKTTLISTVVITYSDSTKADVIGVTRTDA